MQSSKLLVLTIYLSFGAVEIGRADSATAQSVEKANAEKSCKLLEDVQKDLQIPTELAHVSDAYLPTPPLTPAEGIPTNSAFPHFILLQDVHRHPEVQGQISAIIVHAYENWGVKKVFVEGAFSPIDLSVFHRLPEEARGALMQKLIQEGTLCGPELAAVVLMEREWRDPPISPFQLLGMEEPHLYKNNLRAYAQVVKQREKAMHELAALKRLQADLRLPQTHILVRQLDRTEALLNLKLKPSEYEEFLQAKEAVPTSRRLDPAIRAAMDYYQFVYRRSEMFLVEAQRKVPAGPGPRLLVVGGFHTAHMADLLRHEGLSFIVLTPSVTQPGFEPLYEKRLNQTVDALNIPDRPHLNDAAVAALNTSIRTPSRP